MELACSSVLRSRLAADIRDIRPFFYHHADGESASSVREPGWVWPAFSSFSSASPTIITTSGFLAARQSVWDRLRRSAH
jgi:hypothetical protein